VKRGLSKSEILRGRNLFKRVALTGKRIDGRLLRCTYVIGEEGGSRIQVAFKVPSQHLNAVRRNRIRRLMREALMNERPPLDTSLLNSSKRVGMMMFFKVAKGGMTEARLTEVKKISLEEIRKDVEVFCRTIANTVSQSS
jgi:ribonuclease P protein component